MLRLCVTGGGTVAPIDDVRRIANFSTGQFAAQITEAALQQGDEVWHIRTPSALAPFARFASFDLDAPESESEIERLLTLRASYRSVRRRLHLKTLPVGTVREYADTLREVLTREPIDVVFHAAALSDYEPETTVGKLSSGAGEMLLRCVPVPKVIRLVKDWRPQVFLVGFKLLSDVPVEELIRVARSSGALNRADLTVANDFRTVREGRHTVHLVRQDGEAVTLGPGPDMASRLLEHVRRLFQELGERPLG